MRYVLFSLFFLLFGVGCGVVEEDYVVVPSELETQEVELTVEEMGMDVVDSDYGDLSWTYTGVTPKGAAYRGDFSETDDIYFYVSDPQVEANRGASMGDVVHGYVNIEEGFAYLSPGGEEMPLSADLVVGEFEAVNGSVLLVRGETANGPSAWIGLGRYAAIVNLKNAPVTGGAFYSRSTEMSEADWIEFISHIEFVE